MRRKQGLFIEGIGFAGMTLLSFLQLYFTILRGRKKFDLQAFQRELGTIGLRMLPMITLLAMAIGFILGMQVEKILLQFSVQRILLESLVVSTTQEFAPLLVGIFLAGRSGVALAVRIGSMVLNQEVDGLMVCGINPVQYLAGPALLAILLMAFGWVIWCQAIILGTSLGYLWLQQGILFSDIEQSLLNKLVPSDLLLGIIKTMLFALWINLIATVNGSRTQRAQGGVARAATRTMLSSIAAILLTDLAFTLLQPG